MRRTLAMIAAAALAAGGATAVSSTTPADATPGATPPPSFDASGWRSRPARFSESVTRNIPVRMSDGVTLYLDVHRPADADTGEPVDRRFPVLLTQTPYNKNGPGAFHSSYLVRRGYVQVIADVRGTGSSEGEWSSFGAREQRDSLELANWATSARRPWSNGTLGLWGTSYGAINQWFTAAQHPRGLKAMFPVVPAGDVYRDVVASGGALDVGFIPFWLGAVTLAGVVPPEYTATAPDAGLATLLDHLAGAIDFQLSAILDASMAGDQAYDSAWYRLRSPLTVVDRVDVPTFIVGGENDLFQRGEPMLFDRLQHRGVPTKLLYGPWEHVQADPYFGIPALNPIALRWFDHYLRGVADPELDDDIKPVTYYEQGSGRWRTASRWLGDDVHARPYYLSGDPALGRPGTLTRGAMTSGSDPVVPLPVNGLCTRSASQWTAGLTAGNPCDTTDLLNDLDGTSYRTAPLQNDVHLIGPIDARLFVSSSSQDGMLSVHVEDVAPNGNVTRLTGGWQVLSHRALDRDRSVVRDGEVLQPWHPFTQAAQVPMTPGAVARVDVEVFPTGAVLRKGHRLQLTVQAFDVPHLLPSLPGALDSLGILTLHHSARYPSRLVLPVRG